MCFEELAKRISPTLKRITYRLNRHFSFFNDEDLYQEACLRLWLDFKEGKLEDKTDSYILQGCYFHLKNYIRKANLKAQSVSIEALMGSDGAGLHEPLFLEDQASGRYFECLNNKMLAQAIMNNGLTGREKDILSLYSEALTVRQIGRRLGVSHVSVIKSMAKIKAKCRKYLEM